MEWKTVGDELKKLSRKLWAEKLGVNSITSGILGGSAAFITIITSRFMPVLHLKEKLMYIYIAMAAFVTVKTIIDRPSMKEAALCGDRLGFKERFITFLELKGKEHKSHIFEIFLDQLEEDLQNFNLKKTYKIKINSKRTAAFILLIFLSLAAYFMPSASADIASEAENINRDIRSEALKLDEEAKAALEDVKDGEIKKEAMSILDELNSRLNKTYNYEKALGELQKAEEKLKSLEDKAYKNNLRHMSKIFEGTSLQNSSLHVSLLSGNIPEDMMEQNFPISPEDRDKMLENLNNIEEFKESKSIKNEIENKLKSGEIKGKDMASSAKKEIGEEIKLAEELTDSKEKLAAKKNMRDFESREGDKKSDEFSFGERQEGYKYGENSSLNETQEIAKGQGMERRENNDALGSAKTGENSEVKENANEGTIAREDNSVENAGESEVSSVDSRANEEGSMIDKGYSEISGEKGESRTMESTWLKYNEEGIEGVLKAEIPMEKGSLVIDYFQQLKD
ncbi:hypothetical protein OXPF_27950 [Oxobacter pfennigii]|uniref:Uncharacterized protein n=1 Tax=Oxobacter pfennigii TaxID=36849 RepID=A0A0P8WLN0_9CLOT|nr:hypothetical protein [Oxobacter pfennigii]KPU43354.1 hypothetical protein OXPF_27950 [Oxobacter pfennigii]